MNAPQATIVVRFGGGADASAYVAAEFDKLLNVDEAGQEKSAWLPGDTIWFWVQHDPSLRIASIVPTGRSGGVVDQGLAIRTGEVEELTWEADNDAVDLAHLPMAAPELRWYGEPGEGLTRNGRSMVVTGGAPCTCDATYPREVCLFRYIPPPLELADENDKYRVILFVTMEAA
jgi:hypothetical protein